MLKLLKNCLFLASLLFGGIVFSMQPGHPQVVQPQSGQGTFRGVTNPQPSVQSLKNQKKLIKRQLHQAQQGQQTQADDDAMFRWEDYNTFYKFARGVTVALGSAFGIHHYVTKFSPGTYGMAEFLVAGGVIALLDYFQPKIMGTVLATAAGMHYLHTHIKPELVAEVAQKTIEAAPKVVVPAATKVLTVATKAA